MRGLVGPLWRDQRECHLFLAAMPRGDPLQGMAAPAGIGGQSQ